MPRIIYTSFYSGLVEQGDRSVTTFPSGLLKVEQTFIGLTSNEFSDRLTLQIGDPFPLDASPSIDGVFIFPATQETRDINGFTTYKVSGYGRINQNGYSEISPSGYLVASAVDNGAEYPSYWTAKQKLTQRVIYNDQANEDPLNYDFANVPAPIKVYDNPQFPINPTWTLFRVDVQRTNFGRFTELKTLAKYGSGTPLF
jgi:hypothetical protein